MKVAVTGAGGFLGWHARCALHTLGDVDVTLVDRAAWADADALDAAVRNVDAVLHLAGENRAEPAALREVNVGLVIALAEALDRTSTRPVVVFANSIQAGNGTPFGDGKQAAAQYLSAWARRAGAVCVDVRLPNLFGEHSRPHYNSVVATFCHELATGGAPVVDVDRELPLLHAQDAVDRLVDLARAAQSRSVELQTTPTTVSHLLEVLTAQHDTYRSGDIPNLRDPLHLALFNTYRSFGFPNNFPLRPPVHSDARGDLFECVRAHGGEGHVFCSRTVAGRTRGEHFHRRKVERFFVLEGRAEIALRRLFDHRVVRIAVSGSDPGFVDMPTMWAHSIRNVGAEPLITLFWANEILDAQRPDSYAEPVEPAA